MPNETSVTLTETVSGFPETYRFLEYLTPEELLMHLTRSIAAEKITGKSFFSSPDNTVRDLLLRTYVSVEGQ